jgi:putative peptide zinc metalloprotease protein
MVSFPAVDPDRYLDWLHHRLRFVYTWWFTLLTLLAFGFTAGIFIVHWSEVGNDTWQFYNFADKTWGDVAVFWLLGTVLMAIHEGAHGLTCKHYGGHVTSMGFALIYLSPAFFTDTTEGMVTGNRHQRLMISVSGVWSELMVCAIAAPLWWGTAPATALHEFAYTIILITGIGVVLINWNPLMKLDGYHMLCEIIAVPDLKENSTIYVSSWVKRHIWRLPVEVPYVPKRHRLGFTVYALLSGLYSYTVLYVLARFVGNAFRNFNPEWSFIPELATAGLIFRSRIRTLVNFMKFVYLDKKDRILAWFTPGRSWALAAVALVVALLPLWRETTEGLFQLEAAEQATIRSLVPGTVEVVYAEEGKPVREGQTLARLRNLTLESKLARSKSDYQVASARAINAEMRNLDYGSASQEVDRLAQQTRDLSAAVASLEVKSPLSGVVLSPRARDIQGAYVKQGTELIEVGNTRALRARIYVAEPEMYKIRANVYGRLQISGMLGIRQAQSITVSPISSDIAAGLMDISKYKGARAPRFYVVNLWLQNPDNTMKPGMVGTARLYGARRSLAVLAGIEVANFFGRKIW